MPVPSSDLPAVARTHLRAALTNPTAYNAVRDRLNAAFGTLTNATAATLTVTAASHAGQTITLNRAAGITVTLPAATGTGNWYRFFVGTTVTSNNHVIRVADATDTMDGTAWMAQDGGDTDVAFEAGTTDDTITLNGSTKGGIIGDFIVLTDVAADQWSVQAWLQGTGTEATPFSAAV